MKNSFLFRQILMASLAMFSLFFLADTAKGCLCSTTSLEGAIYDSTTIAVFKLQSVEKYAEGEKDYGLYGIKQVKFSVERVFKGKLKIGQQMTFAQGANGDCVLVFNENLIGTEYLMFIDQKFFKDNRWEAFICSRSNTLKGAAADLMYLEKMAKVEGKTRLSGTLSQRNKSAVGGVKGSYNQLAGKTVVISGNGKNIKLKTDENGVYEIYDLPGGKYKVTPEKVLGYRFDDKDVDSEEVEIEEESLTEQDFEFTIDNSISGRLIDASGEPFDDTCLHLLPINGKPARFFMTADARIKMASSSFLKFRSAYTFWRLMKRTKSTHVNLSGLSIIRTKPIASKRLN